MTSRYYPPAFGVAEFHCPHCGVYAEQIWKEILGRDAGRTGFTTIEGLAVAECYRCKEHSFWLDKSMIHPLTSGIPSPSEDMPDDVKADYEEARNIVALSPRAASALLRLSIQLLMPHLGEKGINLNDDIGALVQKGLPGKVQQALDAVRVIGNNAVHPGLLDLKDDSETATSLFDLVNLTIEVMITSPKHVETIFKKIPPTAMEQIKKRDRKPEERG